MTTKHKPFILILSSPSGAGKSTLSKAILAKDHNLEMSISYTTRKMRRNEIDKKDYFFVNEQEFQKLIEDNAFIEHVKVYDNQYGTPKLKVAELLSKGKDVIFDIDWQGTERVKSIMEEEVVTIYILPPSMKELESRLRNRNSDTEEAINHRLSKAKNEISHWENYDYVIVNNNIEESIKFIESILIVERLKRTNYKKIANELLNYES